MPPTRNLKTNFTAGEVLPELVGRGDLRAFENGAKRLRNIFIAPTGGVSRRPGLIHLDVARGPGRLAAFEFNTEQVYLLVFTDHHVDVYKDGEVCADFPAPWSAAQIAQLAWTQSADTLLVVHPEVEPRKITRSSHSSWSIAPWSFFADNGIVKQPYHKFGDEAVTLQPSATTGAVTLTASAAAFQAGHVGLRFRLQSKEVEITSYVSATQAGALCKETLANANASADWEEQSFSALRGWPASVCFHQDRLVIGGSRDLPNRLWLSKSSDLFNFDLGTGLDDESIEFAILSDQVNAIRAVFSGRHLQVFTSGAEWMVTGEPLTPTKIQLKRQTRVGSPVARYLPPRDVDGATLFVSRNGRELREFLFADVEQAYQANDLAMLAHHLMRNPVDMDYDPRRRLLHLAMEDGTLGTVTNYRSEQVTAWTLQTTDGFFRSVAVVEDEVYFLVERDGSFRIERFDASFSTDAALSGSADPPEAAWSGLDHLEGKEVTILADGAPAGVKTVAGGEVTLDHPALAVEIGLPFPHEIEPLPPSVGGGAAQGSAVRLIQATFRLLDTRAIRIDTGKGPVPIPFKRLGAQVLDAPPPSFSGDIKVRAIGWNRDVTQPLWRVAGADPLPLTLLSVSADLKVSD